MIRPVLRAQPVQAAYMLQNKERAISQKSSMKITTYSIHNLSPAP